MIHLLKRIRVKAARTSRRIPKTTILWLLHFDSFDYTDPSAYDVSHSIYEKVASDFRSQASRHLIGSDLPLLRFQVPTRILTSKSLQDLYNCLE